MDSLGAEYQLASDRKSDITLAASSETSNADSDYYKSSNNFPARRDNRTEPVAKIHKLEKMHE